jgi:hypothetical protein
MPEVLLASHIAVLEGPGSNSLEEHLMRGESFIEVAPCLWWFQLRMDCAGWMFFLGESTINHP